METEFPAECVYDELRKTLEFVAEPAEGKCGFSTELPRPR